MIKKEKRNKDRFTTYLPIDMIGKIRELSERTRVPQAALFEEAVADLLEKYYGKLTPSQK
jgi:hypothetical protein